LPVDSEHCAIFQCIGNSNKSSISKLILTASGGPFFGLTRDELKVKTKFDALKHPNWDMGAKISIDSATLMNKGLEIIEAHYLFDMSGDDIDVVVHRQSIIHSMVEYIDGSVIAQLGIPDMRIPIQYALSYPDRLYSSAKKLDFAKLGNLTFDPPDLNSFRCLKLSMQALDEGRGKTIILNAANEVAVHSFLRGEIGFLDIENVVEEALMYIDVLSTGSLDGILDSDRLARDFSAKYIKTLL